jgi:peptidoglycan L-alanyl-D-glutamate endopeptidase CwlK
MTQLTQAAHIASAQKLDGVNPRLVAVVLLAAKYLPAGFGLTIVEGVRERVRQMALYGQGRTAAECKAAGVDPALARPGLRKVTWTLNSRHYRHPVTNTGSAVDLAPYPLDWDDASKFDTISRAMFRAAGELNEQIRWGADWDADGKPRERGESDSPHFELANPIGLAKGGK